VRRLRRLLAAELGWSAQDIALAHMAGLVHDIGTVGLPDDVLREPGRPTPEQWALIHRHDDWGADALAQMRLMPAAVDGVRTHDERWDGSGCPRGLRGHGIPSLGRLVALCDSRERVLPHHQLSVPGRRGPPEALARLPTVSDPLIIEAGPTTALERARRWLRSRRIMLSGILALAEVLAFIIWRPSALLLATLAIALLIVCVLGATRLRPGLFREILWIGAIAQGIVVVIPLVVGLSLVAALAVGVLLIVGLVVAAARWRV